MVVAAEEQTVSFEGTVTATLTRGEAGSQLVFVRRANLVRIENTTNKLEPINILDLGANRLTIIYPHNRTFVRVEAVPKPEGGIGTSHSSMPAGPAPTAPSFRRMAIPAAGTTPTVQTGAAPPATGAGMPGVPGLPPMPVMPGMSGPTELKSTDETKKVQESECKLYKASGRGETLEVWATNDSTFFPFRMLERDFLRQRFGPTMLEEQWPELLREKSLFPLEVTLKMDPGGQERLSFKVEKIERKKITDEKLFQPPEGFIEVQAPRF